MAEVDDWQSVEANDWAPVTPQQPSVPESFLHRLAIGTMLGSVADKSPEELRAKGWGDLNVPANIAAQFKAGLEHVKKGATEGDIFSTPVGLGQAALSPLTGLFQATGGLIEKATGGLIPSEAAQTALMLTPAKGGGPAMIARVRDGAPQVIGDLPNAADFDNAAHVIGDGKAERTDMALKNLQELWEQRGIHPSEAAFDASNDRLVQQEMVERPPDHIVAYHGTTDVIDKFDPGKTRLGLGVYFSDKPELANKFAMGLATDSDPLLIFGDDSPSKIAAFVRQHVGDAEANRIGRLMKEFETADEGQHAKLSNEINDELRKISSLSEDAGGGSPNVTRVQLRLSNPHTVDMGGKFTWAKEREAIEYAQAMGHDSVIFKNAGEGGNFYSVLSKDQIIYGGGEGAELRAAGADVTRDLPTLDEQPPKPPGSIASAGRTALDQLTGLGRNIQFLLDPMATGSNRAMVVAKDAISSVRRIRWEHAQIDKELLNSDGLKAARDRLGETLDQQLARMWNAADEESVLRQEIGIKPGANMQAMQEHMGLATLEPEERAMIEPLHENAQAAWLHAVDVGIVDGEGLPAYTPRMVMNVAAAGDSLAPRALNELGRNVFTRTGNMLHREYLTAEETEAAAQRLVGKRMAERGASQEEIAAAVEKVKIARNIRALPLATARLQEAAIWKEMINKIEDIGKASGSPTVVVGHKPGDGWFTIAGNPAFTKWAPVPELNPVTGRWGIRTDDAGRPLMVPKPIYMPDEFRGPMTSILDESTQKGKVVQTAQSLYGALMTLKGKSMTAILNSPLIHNEVVWSKVAEAAGGREWLGFGLYFRGNRIVNNWQTGRASELIERGLNPMGPRGAIQDITAMMEEPSLQGHQSWTGKVLGFIPGLFDEKAGAAVEQAIQKAGNFWHNTLLWDRVRDLQFGLADHLSDRLVAKGADRLTADRAGAHFSNIIVGSIPKEAMSAGARATANLFLFSRSFTLGNLSTYKQAVTGLPKPILAQIERDFGVSAEEAIPGEAAAESSRLASGIARRKAIGTIAISAGLYYVGNALIQNALNIAMRDSSVEEEMAAYARRYHNLMEDVGKDPWELRHLVGRLSPVYDNEPQKQDRALIGYDRDGTAIYGRNPMGKFGEEMVGYPTKPMTMLRQKLSPLVSGILDVLENDKGFGRKIYDENDTTIGGDARTAFNVASHLVMKHLPEGQINAAVDLLRDQGDPKLSYFRLFAPAAGFTVSVGAPGGPARGEVLNAKTTFDAKFNLAWPDIRKQIMRGDEEGARSALEQLGVPGRMINGLVRNTQDPGGALRGRTLHEFYQKATPEQIRRFENALDRLH